MSKVLLFFCAMMLSSVLTAQHKINGKVTDKGGEPLVGVNIIEVGTANGTSTDNDGVYSFELTSGYVTLEFSFIGYRSERVELKGEPVLNVSLFESILELGSVQVVGSRSFNRTTTNSPVAIDVLDLAEINTSTGKVELNQILQYAAPSFNATKQSGSDGADHIDPASLRGLGPDQTLVLINGKRRHQSSLVNVFGTRGRGNSGTDLNAIPAAAIERIEILRDGASAQYGSDAIAGVINIVLKDNSKGLSGGVTYGGYSTNIGDDYSSKAGDVIYNVAGENRLDGEEKSFDGLSRKIDLNYGVPLGDNGGFSNFTVEYLAKDRTLRPGWSWRKGYGSAAIDGFNIMLNSALPLGDNTELYAFGGRNFRYTDAYAFSRDGFADGDNRAVPSLYPNGFSPRITSNISDISLTAGIRYVMDNGWRADFSNTYGKNNFHYFIKGTNNASLGDASPTEFDAGGHSLAQNTTNVDFTKFYKNVMKGLNIAFGLEYRTENFVIFSGEESSYALYDSNGLAITNPALQTPAVDPNGDQLPSGSQGFPGYSPDNEVDRFRTNFGIYFDTELNVSESFLLSGAFRFEEYSDFGSTANFKLAGKLNITDNLAIRSSVSSGFRAPSLPQIYYNLVFNNIVAGRSERTLLASNNSIVTKSFGIDRLKEETALNFGGGITFNSSFGLSSTIDVYSISVEDRIILTDNFDASALGINVESAQFFANGVDTKTTGIDIVVNYNLQLGENSSIKFGLAGNINDLKIENINNGNLNEYTFFGPFSQAYLKAAAPDYKFGFNVDWQWNNLAVSAAITQFSEVILQDFQWVDTPASNKAEADALLAVATDTYEDAFTLDLSATYSLTNNLKLTIGGNNILNTYPTPQFDGWTDQGGFNDSVQMGSDGAYYYSRITFGF